MIDLFLQRDVCLAFLGILNAQGDPVDGIETTPAFFMQEFTILAEIDLERLAHFGRRRGIRLNPYKMGASGGGPQPYHQQDARQSPNECLPCHRVTPF